MIITISELKANIGRYMDAAGAEEILVTRKGRVIARILPPVNDKMAALHSLIGAAKGVDMTLEEIRSERLDRQ